MEINTLYAAGFSILMFITGIITTDFIFSSTCKNQGLIHTVTGDAYTCTKYTKP